MAKRIAMLISLVMMLSFSCVFATELVSGETPVEAEVVTTISGEATEEVVETTEEVSGEVADVEIVSGEEVEAPVSGEETEAPAEVVETEEGNSSVAGAVIAIVIVVAIIAVVSVLKKK